MFDPKAEYEKWLNTIDSADVKSVDELCRAQVENYSGFFNKLKFGTGGLRAKLGMGLDHMNIWTIGAASQGLANYLLEHFESPSVAIARDSRLCSELFSRRTAEILASSGIKVHYYESIQPILYASLTAQRGWLSRRPITLKNTMDIRSMGQMVAKLLLICATMFKKLLMLLTLLRLSLLSVLIMRLLTD
jgi:hypothetical protein